MSPLVDELRLVAPALVPELRLWLLPPDAPSWTRQDPEALGWPYWAFAWPGGQALARTLLDRPELVRGKRVLDLGSGCAVEALAAARAGASRVTCADLDPLAQQHAAKNADANGVTLELLAPDAHVMGVEGHWDVVLAGDLFFEPGLTARALAWFHAEASRGVTVLLGDAGRVPFDRSRWATLATHLAPYDGGETSARWPVTVACLREP